MNKNNLQQNQASCLAALSPAASPYTNHSPLTTYHSLKRKSAFILAEVLITLGIIGVVAALILPTLIKNHNRKVIATRLEKVYSTMNQAIQMAELDCGERETWFVDYNDLESQKKWIEKYLLPYIHYIKFGEISMQDARNVIYFSDGSALVKVVSNGRDWWFFPGNIEKCIKSPTAHYRNFIGKCAFAFYYNPTEPRKEFSSFGVSKLYNESILKTDSSYGCYNEEKSWHGFCTALIQRNGWKFPKE